VTGKTHEVFEAVLQREAKSRKLLQCWLDMARDSNPYGACAPVDFKSVSVRDARQQAPTSANGIKYFIPAGSARFGERCGEHRDTARRA
jgi:hypothetical protein